SPERASPGEAPQRLPHSRLVPTIPLDLWFERVVTPRLRGEAHMIRYINDFVMCFQYREDALRVQDALCKRLGKFGLILEPTKTKLVEFGRFAQRHAAKHGRKRPETIYFLGFHALLHAEPEGQLQDWDAHREISLAAQSHVVAGPAATNPALVGPGTGQRSQRRTEGPLRLLRHCRKLSFPAKGPSCGRTLLAQNAGQPELGRAHHVG